MEIMDNANINAVNDFFGYDEHPRDAAAVLLIELDGQEAEVQASSERAEVLCRAVGFPWAASGPRPHGMRGALEMQICVFSGENAPTYGKIASFPAAAFRRKPAIERLSQSTAHRWPMFSMPAMAPSSTDPVFTGPPQRGAECEGARCRHPAGVS